MKETQDHHCNQLSMRMCLGINLFKIHSVPFRKLGKTVKLIYTGSHTNKS